MDRIQLDHVTKPAHDKFLQEYLSETGRSAKESTTVPENAKKEPVSSPKNPEQDLNNPESSKVKQDTPTLRPQPTYEGEGCFGHLTSSTRDFRLPNVEITGLDQVHEKPEDVARTRNV